MTSATLDPIFDALASEHRRQIVGRLTAGPVETPVLGADFAISKQALNRHIVVLEEAGLVSRQLRGRVHELTLITDPLDGITSWVSQIRQGWEANFDRLEQAIQQIDVSPDNQTESQIDGPVLGRAQKDERA